jgi:hypothetical protein
MLAAQGAKKKSRVTPFSAQDRTSRPAWPEIEEQIRMGQRTGQSSTSQLVLWITCMGLAAYLAIPASAQGPSVSPPGTTTKKCSIEAGQNGCIIMWTFGGGTATRYLEDITTGYVGHGDTANNLTLACQSSLREDVYAVDIDPGPNGPIIAFSCPSTADFLVMRCKPWQDNGCTIRFAIF